jgi:lysophospholipase L1-like esterase
MAITQGSRIVFTGDSITDCGRARPVGSGEEGTLGEGYVALVDWTLASTGAQPASRILNTGVSGDTVRDLAARWQRDVMDLEPHWVSVMIGINDVWRQFDSDPAIVRPVSLDEYRATLRRLLTSVRPRVQGIVLMLPFYLEPEPGDPMRAMRDRYAEAAADIGGQVGATIVATQTALESVLPLRHRDQLAPDGVHPTGLGHMILARAWMAAAGLPL